MRHKRRTSTPHPLAAQFHQAPTSVRPETQSYVATKNVREPQGITVTDMDRVSLRTLSVGYTPGILPVGCGKQQFGE